MSDLRSALMDSAELWLRRGGYNAFSFGDLAREMKIATATVHYYFPSKADLVVAIVKRHTEKFLAFVAQGIAEGQPVLDVYKEHFRRAIIENDQLCVASVLAAEAGGLPERVLKEARIFFDCCMGELSRRLDERDAEQKAIRIIATLEGAQLLARAFHDQGTFDRAAACLEQELIIENDRRA